MATYHARWHAQPCDPHNHARPSLPSSMFISSVWRAYQNPKPHQPQVSCPSIKHPPTLSSPSQTLIITIAIEFGVAGGIFRVRDALLPGPSRASGLPDRAPIFHSSTRLALLGYERDIVQAMFSRSRFRTLCIGMLLWSIYSLPWGHATDSIQTAHRSLPSP